MVSLRKSPKAARLLPLELVVAVEVAVEVAAEVAADVAVDVVTELATELLVLAPESLLEPDTAESVIALVLALKQIL